MPGVEREPQLSLEQVIAESQSPLMQGLGVTLELAEVRERIISDKEQAERDKQAEIQEVGTRWAEHIGSLKAALRASRTDIDAERERISSAAIEELRAGELTSADFIYLYGLLPSIYGFDQLSAFDYADADRQRDRYRQFVVGAKVLTASFNGYAARAGKPAHIDDVNIIKGGILAVEPAVTQHRSYPGTHLYPVLQLEYEDGSASEELWDDRSRLVVGDEVDEVAAVWLHETEAWNIRNPLSPKDISRTLRGIVQLTALQLESSDLDKLRADVLERIAKNNAWQLGMDNGPALADLRAIGGDELFMKTGRKLLDGATDRFGLTEGKDRVIKMLAEALHVDLDSLTTADRFRRLAETAELFEETTD